MALRLTGISTPADSTGAAGGVPLPTPSRPQSGGAFGNQLATQARTYLATNNLKGYQSLFQTATEHDDPHARYFAQVRLVEEALAAAGRAGSSASATQLFVAAATGAIDALETEPREPILLNYAAVALYELWSLDAAHAIFKAAHALDPALPHLKRNLGELARRRREASQSGRSLKPLHAAVPALASRARKIAKQRPPGKRPEAQPVHDRQGRGRDAPPLPGRGGARRRRDRDRRHRITRPHYRDRPRVQRATSSRRNGPARSPTPATPRSKPPPATGSSISTPMRSSSPTTSAA